MLGNPTTVQEKVEKLGLRWNENAPLKEIYFKMVKGSKNSLHT